MIFIFGLVAGWLAGSMTVVICAICIASGDSDRERSDKEQEEFLRKWGEKHRKI